MTRPITSASFEKKINYNKQSMYSGGKKKSPTPFLQASLRDFGNIICVLRDG